jgi:hypothetical protein
MSGAPLHAEDPLPADLVDALERARSDQRP